MGNKFDVFFSTSSAPVLASPTAVVKGVYQGYSNKENNPQYMSINNYTDTCMRTLGTIIEHKTPRLNYAD